MCASAKGKRKEVMIAIQTPSQEKPHTWVSGLDAWKEIDIRLLKAIADKVMQKCRIVKGRAGSLIDIEGDCLRQLEQLLRDEYHIPPQWIHESPMPRIQASLPDPPGRDSGDEVHWIMPHASTAPQHQQEAETHTAEISERGNRPAPRTPPSEPRPRPPPVCPSRSESGAPPVCQSESESEPRPVCQRKSESETIPPTPKPDPQKSPRKQPKGTIPPTPEPKWEAEITAFEVSRLLARRTTDHHGSWVPPIQRSYEGNLNRYVRDMRACLLKSWDKECQKRSFLTIKRGSLLFEREDRGSASAADEPVSWTTTFPAPDGKFQRAADDQPMNIKRVIRIGDNVVVSWRRNQEIIVDYDEEEEEGEEEKVERARDSMKGKVVARSKSDITAVFTAKPPLKPPDFVPPGEWRPYVKRVNYRITFPPNDVIYRRRALALDYLLQEIPNAPITKIILGEGPVGLPEVPPLLSDASFDYGTTNFRATETQTRAVNFALGNPLPVIQGPPGCGKTAVIAAICHALANRKPEQELRILVCGTSNVSIENLVRTIWPVMEAIQCSLVWAAAKNRDMKPRKDQPSEYGVLLYQLALNRNTTQAQSFACFERASWRRSLTLTETETRDKLRNIVERQICKEATVVCSTLESSARKCLAELRFHVVIVDEATQAIEPSALIPLIHGAQKMILVGDEKQLGPIVSPRSLMAANYGRSLFERLIELRVPSVMLDRQYRMHPAISRFPSAKFYNNKIKNGITAADRPTQQFACFPVKRTPLVFGNFQGAEEKFGTSFQNKTEVTAVQNVIHILLNGGVDEANIGVISPYRGQVELLQSRFPPLRFPKLKIASVDSFQGSERDYIVMSCVRSGGSIGFVSDERRLNVSITRARYGLVIVGDSATLSDCSDAWGDLIKYFASVNAVVTQIPETELIAKPNPDNESGLTMKSIQSPISGGSVRIILPEDADDLAFLSFWVETRMSKFRFGKFVTIALDTEHELCIQIGELFNEDFDPFAPRSEIPIVPPVGSSEGLIIFCKNRNGAPNSTPITAILGPLFAHPDITIATFDCTNDLINLQKIGIDPNFSRVVDCQVHGLPEGISYLTYTQVNSLGFRIECMDIDDPILEEAQAIVAGGKDYPWDANFFIMMVDNLPSTAMVTKAFLNHVACDIALTGLALAEVLIEDKMTALIDSTEAKLEEFLRAQEIYGVSGPHFVREAAFLRRRLTTLLNPKLPGDTVDLLDRWRRLQKLIEMKTQTQDQLLQLGNKKSLVALKKSTETSLRKPTCLEDARFLAKLINPADLK
jgi:regulator of nonsense transcripts 1